MNKEPITSEQRHEVLRKLLQNWFRDAVHNNAQAADINSTIIAYLTEVALADLEGASRHIFADNLMREFDEARESKT